MAERTSTTYLLDNIVNTKLNTINEHDPRFAEKQEFNTFYNELKTKDIRILPSSTTLTKFNGYHIIKVNDNQPGIFYYLLIPTTGLDKNDIKTIEYFFYWLNNYKISPQSTRTINPKWNGAISFGNNKGFGGTNKRRTNKQRTIKRRTNRRLKTNKRRKTNKGR